MGEGGGRWNKGAYFKKKEGMYYRRQLIPVNKNIDKSEITREWMKYKIGWKI